MAASSWQFLDDAGVWQAFSSADGDEMDLVAHPGGEVSLGPHGFRYFVDLNSMAQRNLSNGTIRNIRRMPRGCAGGAGSALLLGSPPAADIEAPAIDVEAAAIDSEDYMTIKELVACNDVAHLDSVWIVNHAQCGEILPKRQLLSVDAFYQDKRCLKAMHF